MDAAVVTSECQSIAEIVENLVVSDDAHNSDDDGNEHEPQDSGEIPDTSFGESTADLDLLCRYVAPQNDTETNVAFQTICLVFSSKRKSGKPPSLSQSPAYRV